MNILTIAKGVVVWIRGCNDIGVGYQYLVYCCKRCLFLMMLCAVVLFVNLGFELMSCALRDEYSELKGWSESETYGQTNGEL